MVALAPLLLVSAALVALAVLRARLVFTTNVNWDEFSFLAKVHSYVRGELSGKLLTFHVHFFTWVVDAFTNEVKQVLAMRVVVFLFDIMAAVATFIIGRRLTGGVAAALFAVVVGQSLSHVLGHGAAARYDPFIVALFLTSAALLLGEGRGRASLAGAIMAIALLVSIKSAIYLPTLAVVLTVRASAQPNGAAARAALLREGALFAVALVVAFAALFAVHAASLAAAPATEGPVRESLVVIARKALVDRDVQTDKYLRATLRQDLGFWILLVVGIAWALVRALRSRTPTSERFASVALMGLALPLATLALYRNAFPYFYVSIVPPAALVASLPLARLLVRLEGRPLAAACLCAALLAPAAWGATTWTAKYGARQNKHQESVVKAVHTVFPAPVPYIDRCSMIASFPKVGLFMSTWTLDEYRRKGKPIFQDVLIRERPQFLLQNVDTLELDEPWSETRIRALLEEDFLVLRDNFIPHWGPLWVAGKQLHLEDGTATAEILIAGSYVVETPFAVRIDGRVAENGAHVELAPGAHAVEAVEDGRTGDVTLRIASALPPPSRLPPEGKIFRSLMFKEPDP